MPTDWELLTRNFDKVLELDQAEKEQIISSFKPLTFKRNEFLLREGEVSRNEYFVVSGSLRQYIIDRNNKEQILRLCIEDWWCGDIKSFIHQTPATYYIQAIENTRILSINRTNWDLLFDKFNMVKRGRLMLQSAVIALHDRTIDNLSLSAQERYVKFLKSYPEVHNRIPLKYIASYLGMTPEFLSELRKQS